MTDPNYPGKEPAIQFVGAQARRIRDLPDVDLPMTPDDIIMLVSGQRLSKATLDFLFSSIHRIQFSLAPTTAGGVGVLTWNPTDGTLEFGLDGGNVTLQIGQEQVVHVYNHTDAAFSEMQVVRIAGSQGQRLTASLAQANNEDNSATSLAVVTESIAKNAVGFATTTGLVRNVDTSAFPEGSALWLSPTVAGGITATKPTAPDHLVMIGWCVRQNANNGSIYVHIQNGYELDELHNVKITSPQNGDVLKYNSTLGCWVNSPP